MSRSDPLFSKYCIFIFDGTHYKKNSLQGITRLVELHIVARDVLMGSLLPFAT